MTELEPRQDNVSNMLTTVQKDNLLLEKPQYRIRKLTPRECGRLMGVSDEDIDKMAAVNSNTQLSDCCKQAKGNAEIAKRHKSCDFQQ